MSLFFNSRNIGSHSIFLINHPWSGRVKECQVYCLSWTALTANTLKGGQYTMLLLDPVAVIILESNWASCLTFVPGVGIATHSLAQLHCVLDKSCWWPRLLSLGLEWDLGSEQPPFFFIYIGRVISVMVSSVFQGCLVYRCRLFCVLMKDEKP